MTAPSPGIMTRFVINLHYPTQDAYLEALGNVMRNEYRSDNCGGKIPSANGRCA